MWPISLVVKFPQLYIQIKPKGQLADRLPKYSASQLIQVWNSISDSIHELVCPTRLQLHHLGLQYIGPTDSLTYLGKTVELKFYH